jgi:hypothetical protein
MRKAALLQIEQVLKSILGPVIAETLTSEKKFKETVQLACENAAAIELARRRGFAD